MLTSACVFCGLSRVPSRIGVFPGQFKNVMGSDAAPELGKVDGLARNTCLNPMAPGR